MLIKLSDGCYVSADEITEVKVNSHRTSITVRTKDGIGHCHEPKWGQGVYTSLDELVAKINSALEQK